MDISNCSVEEISNISALLPLFNQQSSLNYAVIDKLTERINLLLLESDKIYDEQILNFL